MWLTCASSWVGSVVSERLLPPVQAFLHPIRPNLNRSAGEKAHARYHRPFFLSARAERFCRQLSILIQWQPFLRIPHRCAAPHACSSHMATTGEGVRKLQYGDLTPLLCVILSTPQFAVPGEPPISQQCHVLKHNTWPRGRPRGPFGAKLSCRSHGRRPGYNAIQSTCGAVRSISPGGSAKEMIVLREDEAESATVMITLSFSVRALAC